MERIFMERIKENKRLFKKEDFDTIEANLDLMKKIYLLGLVNGKEIYGKI